MEKDIVLAMAKKLQKSLDETGEIRAFLTRRGDYFVSLDDRIKIAQEYGADLFISVHTVEVHLSHAYAKLGVRSRAQLARHSAVRN